MGFYARPSRKLVWQIVADTFVVGWCVLWWFIARQVHDMLMLLAAPFRATGEAAQRMRDQIRDAGRTAGKVPGLGKDLRAPFDGLAAQVDSVAGNAQQQVDAVTQAALAVGVATFLIPVAMLLLLWLPVRIRFLLRQRAARQLIDSAADLDLFALRAMATQPMSELARISPDPVGAWRAGDRAIINRLADLELREDGLSADYALQRSATGRRLG